MSSINPEMLKQLLSEFEEKQAVCREEIAEINNQILELEKRIESSKERLESVARDREKIGLMKQRYQDGDWSSVLSEIQKSSNGAGASTSAKPSTVEPPPFQAGAQTGDYPPVNAAKEPPPANLAPQSVISPPPGQEFPTSFISEAAQAPPPAVSAPAPVVAPPATPEAMPPIAVSSPPPVEAVAANPFEQAPQAPPAAANPTPFQLETPNWEAPQPFQSEPVPAPTPPPAPAPAAAPAPSPSEGLFSFSGQPQPDAAGGADIPWAPPPTMSWESVGNHTFPNPSQGAPEQQQFQQQQQPVQPQQQPPAFQNPPAFPDTNQFGNMPFPQASEPQPPGGFADPSSGAPPGPPGGFMSAPPTPAPPNNQAVLTTAFDDEFDISDALRGEDDTANTDSRDNDKKIKDALRGLFS